MNNAQLTRALEKCADADMGLARRNGRLYIHDTRIGPIEVHHADGVYTVRAARDGTLLSQAMEARTKELLVRIYDVIEEPPSEMTHPKE